MNDAEPRDSHPVSSELDVLVMTLYSKRRPKLTSDATIRQGKERGYVQDFDGRVVLTVHGEIRARELFARQ